MSINISRSNMMCFLISMFVLFPVFLSSIFAIFHLKIPSYAFISSFGIAILIIALFFSKKLLDIRYTISKRNLMFVFFIIWICISFTYTPSAVYSKNKLMLLTYNTLIPVGILMMSFIYCRTPKLNLSAIRKSLNLHSSILLLICAAILIFFGTSGADGRRILPGVDNPIWVSRFFGTILVILLCQEFRKFLLPKNITLILICISCMFISGSRTPLISAILVFILMVIITKGSFAFLKVLLPLSIFGLIFFWFFSGSYIFDTHFYSLFHRFDILKTVSMLISDLPLWGYGYGSFGIMFLGEDVMFYPHNIFVELLFETGYIGLFIFIMMLVFFARNFSGNIVDYLIVYYLILSMTSGDLTGNNVLFILLFISGLFSRGKRSVNNEERSLSFT